MNMYQFNGNNPVMFTDPFGLVVDTPPQGMFSTMGYPGDAEFGMALRDQLSEAAGAVTDFTRNYRDMRQANTIGADKYFHCKANCEASQRGEIGRVISKFISEGREATDVLIKHDPIAASRADRAANYVGRRGGVMIRHPSPGSPSTCSEVCKDLRPAALDKKY